MGGLVDGMMVSAEMGEFLPFFSPVIEVQPIDEGLHLSLITRKLLCFISLFL